MKKIKGKKAPQQARAIHTASIYSCVPLQPAHCDCTPSLMGTWLWKFRGLFAPRRLFSKPLGQSVGTCCAQHCFKKWLGGWRGFILLGSGSLLLSCSFPSPCRLTSFFCSALLSSAFGADPLHVWFRECRRVSFKSKDMRALGQARGAIGHSSSTSRAITQLT